MRYLGLDVHASATVWCLLDENGEPVERGRVDTSWPGLSELASQLTKQDELLAGQEVGTMSQFVHDVFTEVGIRILSFNAQQLRMIACSRKKTDRRDAYWLAKALQTGMMPHPVYIPTGQIRSLRRALAQRTTLVRDRGRWMVRARMCLRAAGYKPPPVRSVQRLHAWLMDRPDGAAEDVVSTLERCQRMHEALSLELAELERSIRGDTSDIPDVRRLMTIPGVGCWTALTIVAWVGDVSRFPNARSLCAYAGLVPSVRQSACVEQLGPITKQGSPIMRHMLVEAAQALLRCRQPQAAPLQAVAHRLAASRRRKKVAVVATARHLLRVAYYVLRDGTSYEPHRLSTSSGN